MRARDANVDRERSPSNNTYIRPQHLCPVKPRSGRAVSRTVAPFRTFCDRLASFAAQLGEQRVHQVGQLGPAGREVAGEITRELARALIALARIQRQGL